VKHVANVALFVAAVIASSCSHSPPPEPPAKPAPEVKPPEPTPPPADTGSATPTDTGSATPAPPVKPAEDTFIERPKTEKLEIMKTKVMPAMAKAFKAQDGKRFAKFNCKTCHGKGAADESFKMPNPDLPKLDFEALHSGKLEPKVAAMAEFMEKTVEPDVANILGLTKFDPAHRELGGFGCLACHEAKK
jgi:mono/diheme cytochrome c family protein